MTLGNIINLRTFLSHSIYILQPVLAVRQEITSNAEISIFKSKSILKAHDLLISHDNVKWREGL